jgi:hypothetical protein
MLVIWYGISSFILGAILFFPLRKFILAMSVNRHMRKTGMEMTGEQRKALKKKVTVVAAVIAITFAFIYNKFVMVKFFGSLTE